MPAKPNTIQIQNFYIEFIIELTELYMYKRINHTGTYPKLNSLEYNLVIPGKILYN